MQAKPGQIPEGHRRCHLEPCVQCQARARLRREDWDVVRLFDFCRDQVTNLNPGGDAYLVPRIEAWLLAMEALGIDPDGAVELLGHARQVFERVEGRISLSEVQTLMPDDVRPPAWVDAKRWPDELTPYEVR